MLKQLGAIFLILGTCVAAAMLGLPVVTAQESYLITVIQVIIAWAIMTAGAWSILYVNLKMPRGSNLISMSEVTLGPIAKWVTWVIYLLLLYCLICAYVSASSDVLQALLAKASIEISRSQSVVLATATLASIVYHGIRAVDLVNRGLLSVKLIICMTIILAVFPHFDISLFQAGETSLNGGSFLVMITAFGYAIIIPSIRDYLDNNEQQLKRVVLIGSILPLVLYLVWIAVIQGAVARVGDTGLIAMQSSANVNSMLMGHLVAVTHYPILQAISVAFISISSITGLLGVSLCTVDFLADGLKVNKVGLMRLGLIALAFLPPMLVVLMKPAIFIGALAYAGMCCIYILIILPLAMYFKMKHIDKLDLKTESVSDH